MRHVYQPRAFTHILHMCNTSKITVLTKMHISAIKTSRSLRTENMCTKLETKQVKCHKANISYVSPKLKEDEVETEDSLDGLEPNVVEAYEDVSYYVENGLRKVYPYYFTYRTFAKERWVGHKLLDVLQNDFKTTSEEEYLWRFQSGAVTVNNEKVELDYILKPHDYIQNTIHRHEAPVMYKPIPIIHLDKDILVINKPASIPVHPCGLYRYNSVLFILAKEYNLKDLRSVHRLDRLTSGLLIFARSREIAQALGHQICNREVKKEYVCRVAGEFPDKVMECGEPIEAIDSKLAMGKVSASGKPSLTVFQKLSYNGKSSVVLCKPTTGRMHQIRVHLQFLGYPILNDALYSGCDNAAEVLEKHLAEIRSGVESCRNHQGEQGILNVTENDFSQLAGSPATSDFDKHCWECKHAAADPHFSDLMIYLHAWKYQGKGWSYKTKLPDWAHENWSCG